MAATKSTIVASFIFLVTDHSITSENQIRIEAPGRVPGAIPQAAPVAAAHRALIKELQKYGATKFRGQLVRVNRLIFAA
ncbi:hypothetical protein GOBAR_AA07056 [Gossypium barbadense]|uniref:Uncharacterized protein n=1 Tax=Gossypium barbadense TaxID=3634 RepID=A0A2P5YD66_GOSBA|nr:hypothetical protein GOBAR_AA07056 [Gossypium barbadense]